MSTASGETPARLLTRHFLDNLIDNDLVSPDADRHAVLAVAVATICSVVLFATMFMALPYLVQFIQLPGVTALSALPDRSLLFGGAMIVTALATLVVWDNLSVEPRDSLILGHLPIPANTIVRAKLTALFRFVATFAVAVNLVPSLIYPTMMVANLPLGLHHLLWLILVHATTGLLAAAFGFFAVFAARGLFRLVLGARWFGRVSATIHSTLTTLATIALLLLPLWAVNVVKSEMPPGGSPYNAPPLWFVGLNEVATGDTIVNAELELPKIRTAVSMLARIYDTDAQARERYRHLQPTLRTLGGMAVLVLPLVAVVAIASYYWTNRRLPLPVSWPASSAWIRRIRAQLLSVLAPNDSTARASFFFTLETFAGSAPHRLSMVIAFALGVTAAVVTLYATSAAAWQSTALPRGVIGAELIFTTALLLGFRNAARVPAELAANWMIQLSWTGDRRAFIEGAKRAAIVVFLLPPILISFGLNAVFFNGADALAHFVCSLAAGWLLLELTLLGYQRLPFTAAMAPGRHVRVRGLFILFGAVLGCRFFSSIEHDALTHLASLATLVGVLLALLVLLRIYDRRSSRPGQPVEFAEPPHALLEVSLGDLVGRM